MSVKRSVPSRWILLLALFAIIGAFALPQGATARVDDGTTEVRFATFNASLNRFRSGELRSDLSTPENAQAQAVAEIIQRTRPDVLLINEFDYDPVALELFKGNYLEVSQNGAAPIDYQHSFIAPSNTGVLSPYDLDNSGGAPRLPGDAYGFGFFEGQFGMALLSRYPIDHDAVRTFRMFLWADMPGALLPDDPSTAAPADYYSAEELDAFRLSSKSHWDVPVLIEGRAVHVLAAHPTPPVFDGPEDRNGLRNYDEIRFWADYVHPARDDYIYDDSGARGGLEPGARFVIMGDYNADPFDGDSYPGAADQLLGHPLVTTKETPDSDGAVEQSRLQGGVNLEHRGNPAFDTADFSEPPGNLRVDYVLPRKSFRIADAGVFWPTTDDPFFRLVGTYPFPSSDHRLVWVDVRVQGTR